MNKKVKIELLKDIDLSYFEEAAEMEAKIAGKELSKKEQEILHAHADKQMKKQEALEKELGRELNAQELGETTAADYTSALRAIYEARLNKDATPGSFKINEHFINAFLLKGLTKASDIKNLQPEIERAIVSSNQTLETVFEGVQVTRAEYELIILIAKLKCEDFKSIANKEGAELEKQHEKQYLGLTRQIRSVKRILITPFELAKEYNGGRKPSGSEIEALEKALFKLSEKKQLIRVRKTEFTSKRYFKDKDGKMKFNKNPDKIEHEIPFFEELFTAQKTVVTSRTYEGQKITSETKRDALIINPSALFDEQLESFFITIPNDFRRRNIEAKNNSLAFTKLQTYFIRQIKYGFLKDEILIDNLYLTIAPKDIKSSRLDKAEKDAANALETCKKIGLLKSYSIVKNKDGKEKLLFELEKDWV